MDKYHENKTPRDEEYVRAYQQTKSQIKAAALCGVSRETIARAVRRAGIPLNGNRDGRGRWRCGTPQKITDVQIIECIESGLTRIEIAEKYNMHVESLPRRMRKLGVRPRRSGCAKRDRNTYNVSGLKCDKRFGDCWHYVKSHDNIVADKQNEFAYIETKNEQNGCKRIRIKCKCCGGVTERDISTVRRNHVECEFCKERIKNESMLEDERIKLMRFFNALAESKKPKECAICGNIFYSEYAQAVYCSDRCKRKAKKDRRKQRDPLRYKESKKKHSRMCRHISRAKKYGVPYVYGITLKAVAKRDNNICQICGKPCDWNDDSWGNGAGPNYPSIDHIIPLSRGGSHTWDNVQCAHLLCNSYKRDLITVKREEART